MGVWGYLAKCVGTLVKCEGNLVMVIWILVNACDDLVNGDSYLANGRCYLANTSHISHRPYNKYLPELDSSCLLLHHTFLN